MYTERIAELLRMFNEEAPIARCYGMTLSFTDEGQAVVDLPYNASLDHALGGVHGGVYATLRGVCHPAGYSRLVHGSRRARHLLLAGDG